MFAKLAGAIAALLAIAPALAEGPPPGAFVAEFPQSVVVSPSGNFVAVVQATGSNSGTLVTARYRAGALVDTRRIDVGDSPVVDIVFKSDDRLLVTVIQKDVQVAGTIKPAGEGRGQISRAIVLSVARDGTDGRILMSESGFGAQVHTALYDDPQHALLEIYDPSRSTTDLYKVDILTGAGEQVERGTSPTSVRKSVTSGWGATADGYAYLRYDQDYARNVVSVFARPRGGDWIKLASYAVTEGEEPVSFAGLASASTIYAIDRAGQDRRGLWEYDLGTGKPSRQVLAAPSGEASGVMLDPYKDTLIGAATIGNGVPRPVFTDKTLAAAQGALDEALAAYPVRAITGYSRDRGLIAVRAEGPSAPPAFYLLDAKAMELIAVARTPGLEPAALGPVETIVYPSSDGRQIVAYLALPPGGKREDLPLIVMPHGGPEAQDTLDFDGWRQFLATRGYAVLQPQFRGSDGFGLAHERAAHGA